MQAEARVWASALPRARAVPRVCKRAAVVSSISNTLLNASNRVACAAASRTVPIASRSFSTTAVKLAALKPLEIQTKDGPLFEANIPVRNVAVIAHVDHGKTSLVDQMLTTCAAVKDGASMDSNPLEKERGITILSKVTGVHYKDVDIAIIDSPGHADFAGQVEQVLGMADSCLLVVCATEGPMVQTRYVLGKAISKGLKPIVVINKADRDTARLGAVENAVFDLFVALDATDEQLDFPIIYTSARHGFATASLDVAKELAAKAQSLGGHEGCLAGDARVTMAPLLDAILSHVPAPRVLGGPEVPFKMLVSQMEVAPYVGKTLIGRIGMGTVKPGDALVGLSREGDKLEEAKVTKLFKRKGMESVPVASASAGEIVELAGFTIPTPTCTVAAMPVVAGPGGPAQASVLAGQIKPLWADPLDPPTISMAFGVNDSPLAGRGPMAGTQLTSTVIASRLLKEASSNIALEVLTGGAAGGTGDSIEVRGRGELQLAVLIETMRREGFELSVSPPTVLFRDVDGQKQEPYETVIVDVDESFSGVAIEKLALRKASMKNFGQAPGGKSRIEFYGPSRGLIGLQSELKSETRGTAVLNRRFEEYGPFVDGLERKPRGVLVSNTSGQITAFALDSLQARGILFVQPGDETYSGMIVGENAKDDRDMEVNPVKAKKLTNIRSAGADDKIILSPPKIMSLEEAIVYVAPDELVEVTPTAIRMRKKILDSGDRERASRDYHKKMK